MAEKFLNSARVAELWAKIKSLLGEKVVMEKVYEVTTTTNMPQIDIPLPNLRDYSRLEISMRLLGTAANTDYVYLRINNLTSGYYTRDTASTSTHTPAVASSNLAEVTAPQTTSSSTNSSSVRCILHLTPEPSIGRACILAEVATFTRWSGLPFFTWTLGSFQLGTLDDATSLNLVPQSGKALAAGCEIIIYGVRR